jgi:hypothetical protein
MVTAVSRICLMIRPGAVITALPAPIPAAVAATTTIATATAAARMMHHSTIVVVIAFVAVAPPPAVVRFATAVKISCITASTSSAERMAAAMIAAAETWRRRWPLVMTSVVIHPAIFAVAGPLAWTPRRRIPDRLTAL